MQWNVDDGVARRTGLPEWFVTSTVEAVASLWIPRLDVEIARTVRETLGPARRVDAALGLSGPRALPRAVRGRAQHTADGGEDPRLHRDVDGGLRGR